MQLLLFSQVYDRGPVCTGDRGFRAFYHYPGNQIARDGKITDDEIKDFAYISQKLDEVSLAIDSLNLWVDKTASEKNINIGLLNAEKAKLEHK